MVEQAAEWLRQGIRDGRWGASVPGVPSLSKECGVAEKTMRQAVLLLEREGTLVNAGGGRRRMVAAAGVGPGMARSLRVGVLLRDRLDSEDESFQICMRQAQSEVEGLGHVWMVLPKTQAELKHDNERVMKLMERTAVDAWLVVACSRRLLEWVAHRPQPACRDWRRVYEHGESGRRRQPYLPGAPGHHPAACRPRAPAHRIPAAALCPRRRGADWHDEVPGGGVGGPWHPGRQGTIFPDWEETPAGLQAQLAAMFRVSPPTAIFSTQPVWMVGILAFLTRKGLRVPEDVSLVCGSDASFLHWRTRPKSHATSTMTHASAAASCNGWTTSPGGERIPGILASRCVWPRACRSGRRGERR